MCSDLFAFDLLQIRSMHYKAIKDENTCKSLIKYLSESSDALDATSKAYLASAHVLMARHYWMPNKKLESFYRGSNMLDSIIQSNADNIEARFLRYCIQYNVPSILGYNKNLSEDKEILILKVDTVKEQELKSAILDFISNPKKY